MSDVERSIDDRVTSSQFWRSAPPRSIEPSAIVSDPLVVRYNPGATTNYTVTNTTARALDNTAGYFDVSGERAVEVRVTASVSPPTGSYVVLSALIDGQARRVAQSNVSGEMTLTGFYTAPAGSIRPGKRLFSVGAHVTGGTATVLAGPADTNYVEMTVRELY